MKDKRQKRVNQSPMNDLYGDFFTEVEVIPPDAVVGGDPPPPPAHWGVVPEDQPTQRNDPPPAPQAAEPDQVKQFPKKKPPKAAVQPEQEYDAPYDDPEPASPAPQRRSRGQTRSNGGYYDDPPAPQGGGGSQQVIYRNPPPAPQSYGSGYNYPGGNGWLRRFAGWFFQDSGTGHPGMDDHQPVWLQILNVVGGSLFWIWGALLTQRYIYVLFPGLKNVSTGSIPLVELFPSNGQGIFGIVEFHLTESWMTTIAVFAFSGLVSFIEFMIFKKQSTRAKRFFILCVFGFDVYMNIVAYVDLLKYTKEYGKEFKWIPFFPKKDEAFEAGSFGIWILSIGTAVMPEIMLSKGTAPARAYVRQAAQQPAGRRR